MSGDGVTIEGVASPDVPASVVVVEANVKTVGIGADVRIGTLTVKCSTTFVVSGSGDSVVRMDAARDDAMDGDGKITMGTGGAGINVFDSDVVRVDDEIRNA